MSIRFESKCCLIVFLFSLLFSPVVLTKLSPGDEVDNKLADIDHDKLTKEETRQDEKFDFVGFGLSQATSDQLNRIMSSSQFIHGFFASLAVIIVSELGDKTFFIAAIMAMRHSRVTILSGALGALALMTVLAAFVGHILSMIPRVVTFYTSSVLLLVFGVKMTIEANGMSASEGLDEFEDVQQQLKKCEDEPHHGTSGIDPESGVFISNSGQTANFLVSLKKVLSALFSKVFLQAFSLTFLAEWGDRSQLATVVLAAREPVGAVIIGGVLGHAICTGIAVLGGRMVAQKISIRAVTYTGAMVFIAFGLSAFYFGP